MLHRKAFCTTSNGLCKIIHASRVWKHLENAMLLLSVEVKTRLESKVRISGVTEGHRLPVEYFAVVTRGSKKLSENGDDVTCHDVALRDVNKIAPTLPRCRCRKLRAKVEPDRKGIFTLLRTEERKACGK